VKYDWGQESADLQRQIAEHALGAVIGKPGKCVYLNVAVAMTQDCDCMGLNQKKITPDVGVVASLDPVAADQAALDLTRKSGSQDLAQVAYPELDASVQLEHAEKVGLGTRRYELRIVES
jgi:uncharacterized Fe-S center protein